ncbi:MAG: sorbosone dehydrogenase family protein [Rhodospirillales bacterium]|nr:sorbosone dehydrogenase family protein [Rhodospirillales bacterium]MYE19474.1 sorbosone dehydrogenase family protein [Rhodospirillales bacterium]
MRTFVLTFLLAGLAVFGTADSVADERLATIRLPDGFVIEPFADVPNARQMAWGEQGTLFVGTRRDGRVFAVTDADGDGRGERVREIASGLQMPSGVAFHDGALYVGAVSTILRFDDIESRLDNPPAPVVVTDRLPSDQHHGWKVLGFGPDGLLYAPVGAPCNVCRVDGYYGSVLRMRPDGSEIEVYARGVRNSVGLAWHPVTGELWFTDNGRDHLGDDLPPCELNRAREAGLHYGFPFCHADTLRDPNLGGDGECADAEPPAQALGPHVAPLGLAIHSGTNLPDSYRGAVFIAEHGSWNRTRKIGYRITVVRLADDHRTALGYETFADGWLKNERAWGRPADVLEAPDGSLMVSDDRAGKVYRIRYVGGTMEAANRS